MAEQNIDKITIEVDATSYKASQALENLEKRLEQLQRAMNGIDVSKLQNTQKAVENVGKSSTSPKIDTSGFDKAERDISNSVSKIQQALAGLQSYANAAMNGDSSSFTSFERRIISIQSSVDVLKEKFAQLGNTNIPTDAMEKLDNQIENTRSHLDALEAKLQKGTDSGGTPISNEEYIKLQTEISETGTRLDELIAKQRELVNQGQAFNDVFGPYKESLDQLEAQLGQTAETVRETVASMNEGATPTVDTSGLDAATSAANTCRVSLLGLFDSAVSGALRGLWNALRGIGSVIRDIHNRSDGFFNRGFMRILKYGFGIRSIYVLFRRLRKAVTESFKELQNSGAFFEETKANVEALKESLTVLKYQFGAAFEPIFNAVAPALKTLVNNLISVMNTISAFTAKLMGKSTYSKAVLNAAAFATNTGKAAKAQKELNKQLQGFDELNNLTTNNSNPSSGSSGSNDDIPGATYVEEKVDSVLGDFGKELAEKIRSGDWEGVGKAISDKLSSAMESINWDAVYQKASNFGSGLASFLNGLITPRLFGNLGTTLAGALNTAFAFLNSFGTTFDWKNFGKSIATGINNFFKTFDFKQVGKTLHTWIAGALDALITFFEETDFEAIGKAIADFIGGLDIPDLVSKLAKLALKIIEALAEAIKGLWNNSSLMGKLGMAIIGLFAFVRLSGLVGTLATLIGGALSGQTLSVAATGTTLSLTGLTLILSGAAMLGSIGSMAYGGSYNNNIDYVNNTAGQNALNSALGYGWSTAGIAGAAGAGAMLKGGSFWKTVGSTLSDIAAPMAAWEFGPQLSNRWAKSYFQNDPEMQKAYDKYAGAFIPFEWKKTGEVIKEIGSAANTGNLKPAVGNMAYDATNYAAEHGTGLIKEPMEQFYYDAMYAFGELWQGIKDDWQPVGDIAKETLSGAWGALQDFGDLVVGGVVNTGSKIKGMYKGSWLESGVNHLKDAFKIGKEALGSVFTDTKLGVGGTSILGAFNGLKESLSGAKSEYGGISQMASDIITKTKSLVGETKNFGTATADTSSTFKSGISDMISNATSVFSTAYSEGTKTWKGIGSWAKKKAKAAGDGFDTLSTTVSGKFDTAYTDSTNKWSQIGTWAKNIVTTASTGMDNMKTDVSKRFGDAYTDSTGKWADLGKWATTQGNTVDNAFKAFPSSASKDFGNAYSDSTKKWDGTKTWASTVFGTIKDTAETKLGGIPGQFQSSFSQGTSKATTQMTVFKSWMDRLDLVKKTGVTTDETSFRTVSSRMANFKSELDKNKNTTIGVTGSGFAAVGREVDNLARKISALKSAKSGLGAGITVNLRGFASGGVVGGATPAIVGEAGPEAILPLTDGTLGKLADMIVGDMAVPQMPVTNNSITSGYGATGSSSSEVARQNQLLQEQNQLLRQIAGKELTISSRDVYDATRQEANNYYNRTGNSPFLF